MAKAAAPKKQKIEKGKRNTLGITPRELTKEQRRELFLAKKSELSKDWKVVQENETEELIPYNFLALDNGLRLVGMPRRGAVVSIHGDEGSSKSSLAYAINREYQHATDEPIAMFDFERTGTSRYYRNIGIDESMAFIMRPESIEEAIKHAVDLMSQGVRLFTFDSIPRMRSMVSLEEIKNGKAFGVQPGTHARAMQQFYDIMLPHIAAVDGTLLMINQTRSRIEMSQDAKSAASGYETITNLNYSLPGGRSHRYAVSVMIENKLLKAYRAGKAAYEDEFILEPEARNGEEYIASEIRLRSLKNKGSGTGYRQASIWTRPGTGVDEMISIRQYGRELGLIKNHGAKYFVGETIDQAIKVYDNKSKAIQDLVIDENEEVLFALKDLISVKMEADLSFGQIEVDDETQRYLAGEQDYNADQDNHVPSSMIPEGDEEDLG